MVTGCGGAILPPLSTTRSPHNPVRAQTAEHEHWSVVDRLVLAECCRRLSKPANDLLLGAGARVGTAFGRPAGDSAMDRGAARRDPKSDGAARAGVDRLFDHRLFRRYAVPGRDGPHSVRGRRLNYRRWTSGRLSGWTHALAAAGRLCWSDLVCIVPVALAGHLFPAFGRRSPYK